MPTPREAAFYPTVERTPAQAEKGELNPVFPGEGSSRVREPSQ